MSTTEGATIRTNYYAGAAWLKHSLASQRTARGLCPFGERVADLLGWVFEGIYHISDAVLADKAVWDNDRYARISLGWQDLSTFDTSTLTRLVVACHDLAIRMEVNPCNFHHVELLFHPRQRDGAGFERHPTIEWQIERFRREGRAE